MFFDDILLRGASFVIPEYLKEGVLRLAHEDHPGLDVMIRGDREEVWWPTIDKEGEGCVGGCHESIMVSSSDDKVILTQNSSCTFLGSRN